jgi:hypothetical protein
LEKLVYLVHSARTAAASDLRTRLIDVAARALRDAGASSISVNVHDEHVAPGTGVTISRSDPPIAAMVSFWMQNSDDREPCEQALAREADAVHGYLTAESRPLVHVPPLGERAPGFNLVTAINRRPDLTHEQFTEHWTHEHKVVANETQSTFGYVRNAVVRPLSKGAPVRDGIVEESFPIEALTDRHAWYDCDSAEEFKRRLGRMLASVNAFLDMEPLESIPMSEYWLG